MDDQELQQRAATGDTVAQFDLLIHRHGYASDGSRAADGGTRNPLRLRPSPESRVFPGVHRRMDLVDGELVVVFRRLVAGDAPWPLFLHGGVGTGKTFAALCLIDFAASAAYHTVERLCDVTMQQSSTDPANEWGGIAGKELVVLDEIGTRMRVGDLEYSVVKRVLDVREFNAGGRGIYISNLPPEPLRDLYDVRIVSRLTAGTVFRLDGPDRRRRP